MWRNPIEANAPMASEASPSLRGRSRDKVSSLRGRRPWQSRFSCFGGSASLQHGLPRRFAPRSDGCRVAAAATKCCHCEAAGRGNPGLHALAVVTSLQHGLPRRFAPRSDGCRVAAGRGKVSSLQGRGKVSSLRGRGNLSSLRGRRPWQSRTLCFGGSDLIAAWTAASLRSSQ